MGAVLLWFGVACAWLGLQLGWPGVPPLWLAASCAWVGVAFAMDKPALMGKRADGTFHWVALLVLAPFLAAAWAAWWLHRRRGEPCWNEVAPGLFFGRLALPHELPPGTALVVDLTCELVEPRSIRRGSYRCLPTLDGHAPPREPFAALVHEIAMSSKPVFIHCAAGHGRSATLAAAVLMARGMADDVAAAEALLKRSRPKSHIAPAQRRLLAEVGS